MTAVVRVLALITYIGPYGAYWINLGAMVYTMIIGIEASESPLTQTEGIIWTSSYAGLTAISTTVSFLFVPSILEWYTRWRKLQDDKEAQEKAEQEAAENEAKANSAVTQDDDDDDIFVF